MSDRSRDNQEKSQNESSILDNLVIASPCPVSWQTMSLTEDERKRLCKQCDRHVYNLSGMSKTEAVELLTGSTDRICVNFYQRPDGKVMTDDCPAAFRALRNRYRKVASVIAGIICSLFPWMPAKSQSLPPLGGEACIVPPPSVNNKLYDKSAYAKKNLSRLAGLSSSWVKARPEKGVLRVTVAPSGKVEDCVVITSTGNTKTDVNLVREIKKTRLGSFDSAKKRKFLLLDYAKIAKKENKKSAGH